MTSPKQPRTIEAATSLCERYAEIEGKIAAIEQARNELIASANGAADADMLPLIEERDAIAEKIKPWWMKAKDDLLSGKAKSMVLGGCKIGCQKGKDKLAYSGKEDKPVKALEGLQWAKKFIRVTLSIDAAATVKGLDGYHGPKLREAGFSLARGEDMFFIARAEQGGTVAKAAK